MKFIYPEFKEIIEERKLINQGETIIVALSGGKDSVALTYLLKEIKKDIGFTLIGAYFNHKIRDDSKEEESWVKQFCKNLNIKLETDSAEVKEYIKKKKINLENGASILRYNFFNSLLAKHKKSKIFTAHTKSDATETFLIKLFRGSGLQGLTSISMIKEALFIRPLLYLTKEQILDFLNRNNINYYTDYSNKNNEFLRNRIRNSLIPEIKKIEPNIDESINKTIKIIKEEYNYFSEAAKKILEAEVILNQILPLSVLSRYHIAIQRHIIREYIRKNKGNLFNINFDHIQELISENKKKSMSLPGINFTKKKNFLFPSNININNYEYYIKKTDSEIIIPEIQKKILIRKSSFFLKPNNNYEIIIPITKLIFPLIIRSPQKGDKYIKINSEYNIEVFEMIRNSNIPPELRNLNPILINGNGIIIWVYGSPISDKFKVSNKNGSFVSISMETLINDHK